MLLGWWKGAIANLTLFQGLSTKNWVQKKTGCKKTGCKKLGAKKLGAKQLGAKNWVFVLAHFSKQGAKRLGAKNWVQKNWVQKNWVQKTGCKCAFNKNCYVTSLFQHVFLPVRETVIILLLLYE